MQMHNSTMKANNVTSNASKAQVNVSANASKSAKVNLATIDPLHPEGLVRAPKDKQYEQPYY